MTEPDENNEEIATPAAEMPADAEASADEDTGTVIRETDIVFDCPHCSKTLVIDYRGAGLQISCSECGKDVLVPIPDGMELTDLDMDPGEILKQLFATRRNYQKAESQVQKLKARLVSLQEALGAMQEVIAEGLASE